MLYNLVIFPLVQIIELTFMVFKRLFNTGFALLGVSAAVSVLTLPLYFMAEKWQVIERETQKTLAPGIAKIKAVFKGDEQYLILSTFYRQHRYHPLYALRSSFGLLIQIPFFIAAYSYLSNAESLHGASFLWIRDLGAPDVLFAAQPEVHLFPLIMTAVNIIAGAIYTKGFPVKEKVQLYGMAAVFLVLLYNSPAGLVLYWTANNLFSLAKNIFQKAKLPAVLLLPLIVMAVLSMDAYALFIHKGYFAKRLLLVIFVTALGAIPFAVMLFRRHPQRSPGHGIALSFPARTFWMSTASLFLLTGAVIPLALMASSVQEFSYLTPFTSPFPFAAHTMSQSAGFFLIWLPLIYYLSPPKTRNVMAILLALALFPALLDTFAFPGDYGFLTTSLILSNPGFKTGPLIPLAQWGITLVVTALALLVMLRGRNRLFPALEVITVLTLTAFSLFNGIKISRDWTHFAALQQNPGQEKTMESVYTLSRDGKNVVLIMLDRAMSIFIPRIFEEKPALNEAFSGFTWYPNCASFGGITIFGAPPLFGGYEYTPEKLAKNNGAPLVERHNEALLMLPKLFADNHFRVTVTDPSWANYSWKPDLRIFAPYPEIRAQNLAGAYSGLWSQQHPEAEVFAPGSFLKNNLLRFSFFKITPPILRPFIYDDGKWLVKINASAGSLPLTTLDEYAPLDFLPQITRITPDGENTFTVLVNQLTHEPAFLDPDTYVPSKNARPGVGLFANRDDYHVNMAALLLLGKWFDFLKARNAYDNTRIIIAADHGWGEQEFNPLLLVKDFYDSGPLRTDGSFMTNADAPLLAVQNLIPNPVNPFTKVPLAGDKARGITATTSGAWSPDHHNKFNFRINDTEWLHLDGAVMETNR